MIPLYSPENLKNSVIVLSHIFYYYLFYLNWTCVSVVALVVTLWKNIVVISCCLVLLQLSWLWFEFWMHKICRVAGNVWPAGSVLSWYLNIGKRSSVFFVTAGSILNDIEPMLALRSKIHWPTSDIRLRSTKNQMSGSTAVKHWLTIWIILCSVISNYFVYVSLFVQILFSNFMFPDFIYSRVGSKSWCSI